MVRYKDHTLMREDREAFAAGAGSKGLLGSFSVWGTGETRGRTVERASGRRRVRKRVEACR